MERKALQIDHGPLWSVYTSCPGLQFRFKSTGPPHALVFEVRVFYLLLRKEYMAIGFSKQSAKQNVAKLIFEDLVTGVQTGHLSCSKGIFGVASVVPASKTLNVPGFISFDGPVAKRLKPEDVGRNLDSSTPPIATLSSRIESPLEEQPPVTKVNHVPVERFNIPTTFSLQPDLSACESTAFHDVDSHDPASTDNINTQDTTLLEASSLPEACDSRPKNPNWFTVSDLEMWNPTDDPEQQYDSFGDPVYSYGNQNCSSNLVQLVTAPTAIELIPRDREMMVIGPGKVPFVRKHFVAAGATKNYDNIPDCDDTKQCDTDSKEPFNVNPLALQLVTKMGWSQGRGLGKSNQGRTEPVQPVTRPSKDVNAGLGYN